MEEEFHESDIVFSENSLSLPNTITTSRPASSSRKLQKTAAATIVTTNKLSTPLDIPEGNSLRYVEDGDNEDGYEDIERRKLPPHLIIARRIKNVSNQMACSYCVQDGQGRILKGRNLFHVRNSILRLTGFIET